MKIRSSEFAAWEVLFAHGARWRMQVIEVEEVEARKVGDRLDLDGCRW